MNPWNGNRCPTHEAATTAAGSKRPQVKLCKHLELHSTTAAILDRAAPGNEQQSEQTPSCTPCRAEPYNTSKQVLNSFLRKPGMTILCTSDKLEFGQTQIRRIDKKNRVSAPPVYSSVRTNETRHHELDARIAEKKPRECAKSVTARSDIHIQKMDTRA